ncbi:MAG: hypothetical protein WCF67_19310, partial [Chitinophagaceae bacterium]
TERLYIKNNKYGNYSIVGGALKKGNNFYYSIHIPQDSFTRAYSNLLFSIDGLVHDCGEGPFKDLYGKFGVDDEGNLVYVDDYQERRDDKIYLYKYKGKQLIYKKQLKIDYHKAYLSPNGKYMLYDTYEQGIYLMDTESFKTTKLDLKDGEIFSVNWSKDSKNLAIVQYHNEIGETDLLTLFRIK